MTVSFKSTANLIVRARQTPSKASKDKWRSSSKTSIGEDYQLAKSSNVGWDIYG